MEISSLTKVGLQRCYATYEPIAAPTAASLVDSFYVRSHNLSCLAYPRANHASVVFMFSAVSSSSQIISSSCPITDDVEK